MQPAAPTPQPTYRNPIFGRNFPDPFVLKFCGEYWAYCTGGWSDGRIFGILHSRNLVHWQEVGGAMEPLPDSYPCYWAPEVLYDNGRFYLYYSVGDETNMHIRVAVARHPAGPFEDSGHRLTREPFAIDAHVFLDDDGRRYLFYATDFLDHERIGTGTVIDRLLDPFTLTGQPRPVTRARYDWQIYDPQRAEKGGVRWHTLEGPFVLKRKGIYYQMFSGGNWQNPSYGVGYAVTRNLDTPDEWQQACDGERTPPILRTIPDQVIGPGHNSVVRGPDNRQLYCVYHRWGNGDGRLLAIDPLDFAGERMLILGPSHTPQPAPLQPSFADFFDGETLNGVWQVSGQWRLNKGIAVAEGGIGQTAEVVYDAGTTAFLAEVSMRALENGGGYGLNLLDEHQTLLRLHFVPTQNQIMIVWGDSRNWQAWPIPLPEGFNFYAYHLVRVTVDGRHLCLCLDDYKINWQGKLAAAPTHIALNAKRTQAAFAGFSLTRGWQNAFNRGDSPADLGWESNNSTDWAIEAQQLIFANSDGTSLLQKGPSLIAYELVVNARLTSGACYGIAPTQTAGGVGPLLTIERNGNDWIARWQDTEKTQLFPLPDTFDPAVYQQFRLRKENGRLTIHWEQHQIATLPATTEPTCIGLYGQCATATFDMVRVTAVAEVI